MAAASSSDLGSDRKNCRKIKMNSPPCSPKPNNVGSQRAALDWEMPMAPYSRYRGMMIV